MSSINTDAAGIQPTWSQLNIKYGCNLKNDCRNVIATFPAQISPRTHPGFCVSLWDAAPTFLPPSKCPRPGWRGIGALWDSGRCATRWDLRSPPTPTIPGFHNSVTPHPHSWLWQEHQVQVPKFSTLTCTRKALE